MEIICCKRTKITYTNFSLFSSIMKSWERKKKKKKEKAKEEKSTNNERKEGKRKEKSLVVPIYIHTHILTRDTLKDWRRSLKQYREN